MKASLEGQWIGDYKATFSGKITVDVDEFEEFYDGYAVIYYPDMNLPTLFVRFRTLGKQLPQTLDLNPFALDPRTFDPTSWDTIKHFYPDNLTFAPTVKVEVNLVDDVLKIKVASQNDIGTAELPRSRAGNKSELVPLSINTWGEFKSHVEALPTQRYAFRGQQSNLWRLRTSYHRTGKAHIGHYADVVNGSVAKHLSAQTRHLFNLRDDQQLGAFVTLIQHHGFPTPLLDWTHSPYVAAFFAFRNFVVRSQKKFFTGPQKIRIYKFALHDWNILPHLLKLSPAPPHVSILDAIALENARMLPQQAISTFTNVDDIESHIREKENALGRVYLEAIDLPVSELKEVRRDLALMGITAGSLFPGLDGACEQLRDMFFPTSLPP